MKTHTKVAVEMLVRYKGRQGTATSRCRRTEQRVRSAPPRGLRSESRRQCWLRLTRLSEARGGQWREPAARSSFPRASRHPGALSPRADPLSCAPLLH